MRFGFSLIFLLFAWFPGAGYAESAPGIYKLVGSDGRITYTDRKPGDTGQKAEKLNIGTWLGAPQAGSNDGAVKRVTLISAQWCGVCRKAKAYLASRNIAYDEWDIDTSEYARGRMKSLKASGVPVILYQSRHLVGFTPEAFNALLEPGT